MTIKINGTNTTAQPSITGADTDTGLVYGTDQVQVVTGGTTRATVDSSGNLGVGTASFPANGTNLKTSDGTIARHILEKTGSDARIFEIGNGGTFLNIYDATADSERLRITSDGKCGIATTSPAERLDVRRAGYGNVAFFADDSARGLYIKTTSDAAGLDSRNSSTALSFSINGSEKARVQTGGGISFNGDTAAANALDDYEEGTWTPFYNNGITNPTYTATDGSYTKIGCLVTFTARIQATGGSNNGNHVVIGGLPFTSNSSKREGGAFFNFRHNLNGTNASPFLYISTNSNAILFYNEVGGNWGGTNGSGLLNRALYINGYYFV